MEPLIGTSATQFDARKFSWLGSGTDEVSICATWHTSRVKTWNDMLTISVHRSAVEGSGSYTDIFSRGGAQPLRRQDSSFVLGLSRHLPKLALAIERGEVDGRCGWSWVEP